jgi:peptide/nickel transport system permease protein
MPSIVRHGLGLIGVLFAVSLVTFLLLNLIPGDPALAILGETATPQSIAVLHAQLGLDLPLPLRFLQWLGHALTGDLGRTFKSGDAVSSLILQRLPVTLELLVIAQFLALAISIPLGIWTAYRARRIVDHVSLGFSLSLLSMPSFLVGTLLIYGLALNLGLFPATGFVPISDGLGANLQSVALPSATLALVEFPIYMRLLRSEMMQTLRQNFIAVSRAMGLPTWRILIQHALRPSSINLVTVLGINMGRLIGGAVIVEVLFALPGIGQLLVNSIFEKEILVVQGVVLFTGVFFVLINMRVDRLYALLDPRVRLDAARR